MSSPLDPIDPIALLLNHLRPEVKPASPRPNRETHTGAPAATTAAPAVNPYHQDTMAQDAATPAAPAFNPYYQDTMAQAGEMPVPQPEAEKGLANGHVIVHTDKGRVDYRLEEIDFQIDSELEKDERDYEKLFAMIYSVLMLMSRLAAKSDQEKIQEIQVRVKSQAKEIKATYNTWQGMSITIFSAGVNIFAGAAGLAPLFPVSMIAAETAKNLAQSATPVSYAGQGIGGIGSLFDKRSEGNRRVFEIYLQRYQGTEEERKSSKHSKGDHLKTAKAAADEFQRNKHEAFRATAAA